MCVGLCIYVCFIVIHACVCVIVCMFFRTRVRMCAILQGGENPVIHSHHILLDMDCGHAMLGKCSWATSLRSCSVRRLANSFERKVRTEKNMNLLRLILLMNLFNNLPVYLFIYFGILVVLSFACLFVHVCLSGSVQLKNSISLKYFTDIPPCVPSLNLDFTFIFCIFRLSSVVFLCFSLCNHFFFT